MTLSDLAGGWTVGGSTSEPLLSGPRAALRVDATVRRWIEGRGDPDNPLFAETLERVLARTGAFGADEVDRSEPPRPLAPATGPAVSIVIPNVNAAPLLEECLASIAEQTYAPIEVIVVDGGSTDASLETADAYGARIVALPPGTNFSEACNAGAESAAGEQILLLNNDTRLAEDAVAQMARLADTDVAAVCAMTRRADLPGVVESLGNVYGHGGFGAGRFAGFVDLGQFAREPELFSAAFTAVLISRRAWEDVGPLDPAYGFYYEDVDWSMRARIDRWRILPAPHALVWHEGSASTARAPSRVKLTHVTRNRLVMTQKVLRARTAQSFLRAFVKEDVKSVIRSVRRGDIEQLGIVAESWAGAAVRIPPVRRARRRLGGHHNLDMHLLFANQNGPALMSGSYPLIDAAAIRGYYMRALVDADAFSGAASAGP
jgi:GT2 family glycosyltransferase